MTRRGGRVWEEQPTNRARLRAIRQERRKARLRRATRIAEAITETALTLLLAVEVLLASAFVAASLLLTPP